MLINLSNHPSSKWVFEQKKTAMELYNEILDLDFPNIDPHLSFDDLKILVTKYVEKILTKLENKSATNNAIHIMGEFTFLYCFVKEMEKHNILCVASTTERVVVENPDGTKSSLFYFLKFREYFKNK